MEDPWANAWGDSPKPSIPEPSQLWAAPSVSVLHADNEPPWPKDPVSNWSPEDLSADHIWSTTEISSTPTLDGTLLEGGDLPQESSRTETQETGGYSSSSLPLHEKDAWALPKTRLQILSTPQSFSRPILSEPTNASIIELENESSRSPRSSPSPISRPKSICASLSEDVDVFGSFETGKDDTEKESWTPTNSALPPISSTVSANWDTAWQVKSEQENNEQEDAWEAARRQKEKRDRHVPPEFLSSVLRQFEEFSTDKWEDLGSSSAEDNDNLDFEMLGLNPILTRLSPDDMTLPPTVSFAKTFTMKHMSESLKLTRHCTSTRLSPMAMYLASKGSNSWEAAIKTRPIVAPDDVTPVGWKILDSSTKGESPVDDGRRKVGGIFSFFGRRTHNLSVDGSSIQATSPTTTSGVSPPKTLTPRAGSPSAVESNNTPERSTPAISEPPNVVSEVDTKSTSTIPTADVAKDEIQPEATQPSAVSRFLGRIVGRSKTRSIDSLALSADDLNFLADVPTSSDGGLKNEDPMTILETPPPLPPCPLTPPARRGSPLPKLPPPPSRSTQRGGGDDLLSLFGPTPTPNLPDNPLTMNPPPPCAMSSGEAATCQSTVSNVAFPNRMWATFEKPAIKSTSSSSHLSIDTLDLLKSPSSRPTTNGIKLDVFQIPKASGSGPIPVLAPPMSMSTVLPSKTVQVDDDEFSDFLSSPAVQNYQRNSSPPNIPPVSVPSIKMADAHQDDFSEFGEFPASKPHSSATHAPTVVSIQSETRKKASKKADHSRTLSLLENAAARGRWLSPPSPIPEALSPPPGRSASSSATVGPGHKLDMQTQQSFAMAAYSSDKSADSAYVWRLPPPPLLKPSVIPSTPVNSRLMPPSRPEFMAQSRSPSSTQPGGLSAQDLSFFEGL